MLDRKALILKRAFDVIFSFVGLFFFSIPIVFLMIVSSFSCGGFGFYKQIRVGRRAKLFKIYKIRTMKMLELPKKSELLNLDKFGITIKGDKRITPFGNFLRKYKLDELPQLLNVFIGNMSLVGPRPDVVGYADELQDKDRIILTVKPGITGPATLAFRNEEQLLLNNECPITYNNEVIWPRKIELNVDYIQSWSFKKDIYYIFKTIFN